MNKKKTLYTSLAAIVLASFSATGLADEVTTTRATTEVSLMVPTSGAQSSVVEAVILYDATGQELYRGSANGHTDLSSLLVSLGLPETAQATNETMAVAEDGSVYYSATVILPEISETPVSESVSSDEVSSSRQSTEVSLMVPTAGGRASVVDTVILYDAAGQELYRGTANGHTGLSSLLVSLGLPEVVQVTNETMAVAEDGSVYYSATVILPEVSISPAFSSPASVATEVSLLVPTSGSQATEVVDVVILYDESGNEIYNGSAQGFKKLSDLLEILGLPTTAQFTNGDMGVDSSGAVYLSGTVILPEGTGETVDPKPETTDSTSKNQQTGLIKNTPITKTPEGVGQGVADKSNSTSSVASATTSQSATKTSTVTNQSASKDSKSLPNTGDTPTIIGMIGLGLSTLGLVGFKRRK